MFKGCHFPSEVLLETIRYYLAYKLSYRGIEDIQLERGVIIDHATINRWVIKFTPLLEHNLRRKKKTVSGAWRLDETYIKVKGSGSTTIGLSIKLAMSLIIASILIVMRRRRPF